MVEWIFLASAVAGGLLLHAAADVVDRGVGELRDVEVVEDQRGVG